MDAREWEPGVLARQPGEAAAAMRPPDPGPPGPETVRLSEHRARADRSWAAFMAQCQAGPVCDVELYDRSKCDDDVRSYAVLQVKPGTYRAVVLYHDSGRHPELVQGMESSRPAAAAWLRSMGVPCLRIGAAGRRVLA